MKLQYFARSHLIVWSTEYPVLPTRYCSTTTVQSKVGGECRAVVKLEEGIMKSLICAIRPAKLDF